MTRLAGHALHKEGAAYNQAAKDAPGRPVTTRGTGNARCSCGTFSGVLPSATKRQEWHRNHKAAVRNITARQEALGVPARSVSIVAVISPPYACWALHFAGFENEAPEPVFYVGPFKGESTGDLVFQAVTGLMGVPEANAQPLLIHINNRDMRQLLGASLHLLPEMWTLSSAPIDDEVLAACRALFAKVTTKLRKEPAPKTRTVDALGKRTVLAASDASCHQLGTFVKGVEESRASAGWVIFDLVSNGIEIGYRKLQDGPVRIEHRELEAIECVLQAIAAHPIGASRKWAIRKIVVMSDSAQAVAMANSWQRKKDPITARIQSLVKQIDIPVEFQWVKGHDSNLWNVTADALASHALKQFASDEEEARALALIEGKLHAAQKSAENSERRRLASQEKRAQRASMASAVTGLAPDVATAASSFLASRARNLRPELQHAKTG